MSEQKVGKVYEWLPLKVKLLLVEGKPGICVESKASWC